MAVRERETSACSLDGDGESYIGEEDEEEIVEGEVGGEGKLGSDGVMETKMTRIIGPPRLGV